MNIFSVETPGDLDPELPSEEDNQKSLGFLLEKVEGCSVSVVYLEGLINIPKLSKKKLKTEMYN